MLATYLLENYGLHVEVPNGRDHVCICVALMGWSWACWLGQTVLEDLLGRVPNLRREWRLMYGIPMPRFVIRIIGQCLHFQYIDDFGGLLLCIPLRDGGPDLTMARRILKLCRNVLRSFGMGCHKVVMG